MNGRVSAAGSPREPLLLGMRCGRGGEEQPGAADQNAAHREDEPCRMQEENRENALACRGRESRLGCVRRMKPVGGHRPAEERVSIRRAGGKIWVVPRNLAFRPNRGREAFFISRKGSRGKGGSYETDGILRKIWRTAPRHAAAGGGLGAEQAGHGRRHLPRPQGPGRRPTGRVRRVRTRGGLRAGRGGAAPERGRGGGRRPPPERGDL